MSKPIESSFGGGGWKKRMILFGLKKYVFKYIYSQIIYKCTMLSWWKFKFRFVIIEVHCIFKHLNFEQHQSFCLYRAYVKVLIITCVFGLSNGRHQHRYCNNTEHWRIKVRFKTVIVRGYVHIEILEPNFIHIYLKTFKYLILKTKGNIQIMS